MGLPATPLMDDQPLYGRLLAASRGRFGDHALASMLTSWHAGRGAMPQWMGLDETTFQRMLASHFPDFNEAITVPAASAWNPDSMPEYGELHSLFTEFQSPKACSEPWWVALLIAGCNGRNHLWEDLGLFNRTDLGRLMRFYFPELAARNSRDMKWKKFIYKQLCDREGIIACPAPTCDACASFADCFAPED